MNNVRPIKNASMLARIMEGLQDGKTWHDRRMFLLFATGIYTGLRISDIIGLKVENVQGDSIVLIEKKTGKQQRAPINKALRAIYDVRLEGMDAGDYLFPSRKHFKDGQTRHITTRAASYDMRKIAEKFGIKEPFGCHSMRKTYGYMMYKRHNVPIEALRDYFNHASEDVTRRYICIDEDERIEIANRFDAGGFRPEKPGKKTAGRRKNSVPVETTHQDRTENGRKYADALRKQADKRRKISKK